MAGATNTGVINYVSNPVACFPANSITVDIFGNTFYRNYAFGAGDDTGVYWNTEVVYPERVMVFICAAMRKSLLGKFSFGKKLRSSQSYNLKMLLPTQNGKIDFQFMETFIADLEAEQIVELENQHAAEKSAYLSVSGLKDICLSTEEKTALEKMKGIVWKSFNLKELFGEATRGKRLKSEDRIAGTLPFVTAGESEEGVSAFIGNDVMIFSQNTITIDMFGSAKYRNYNYGADDHIAVVHTEHIPKLAAIFITAAIHKAAHTGKFSYSKNFYAKDADELNISLPVKNGGPDYEIMELVISAIQKLVIRDVIAYGKQKLAATKQVIENG